MNDCQPGEKCWMSSMEPCRYIARTFLFITIKHLQTNIYSTKTKERNPANSTATKMEGRKKKEEEEDQFFFSKNNQVIQ